MKTIRNILLACAILSCVSMPVWGGPVFSCVPTQVNGDGKLNLRNKKLTDIDLREILINIINEDLAFTVRSLDLSRNRLTSLPSEIGQLTNLTKLDLSYNRLTVLPVEICQLTNLKELNIECSHVTVLPSEIGQLRSLTKLNLSFNKLTSLPPEIGQLRSLKTLILSFNKLISLSSEIGQLTSLKKLYLSCNPQPIKLPESLLEKERMRKGRLEIWR